jgi:hypothetical protein
MKSSQLVDKESHQLQDIRLLSLSLLYFRSLLASRRHDKTAYTNKVTSLTT